ncbi:MAG TPA: peptide deformylase [Spirochaetia bacterium]|nr:MAG: peptide deformylase [Spirochaetes bacterium GWB1_36_13]HCL56193.1 peptide deformylase [Spirochaetia bacterium]
MVRKICYYGNPILRKKAAKVEKFDNELKELIDDMIETMYEADGVGLAAPQIGESLQIAIVDPDPSQNGLTRIVLMNPEIETIGIESEVKEEGCLSVPGIYSEVKRNLRLKVKAQDIDGSPLEFEADGFFARIIQHETDHLNGVLFVDKVIPREKSKVEKKLKELFKFHAV